MSSGFNQSGNQLAPSFYRVVITMTGGVASWPTLPGTDGPTNGAINPTDWNGFVTRPSSSAKASSLARGNLRFQAIIEELCRFSDCQILDVEVTSAGNTDANNQPTAISFTARYDRDEFILGSYQALMLSEDPTNVTFVGYGEGVNVVDTTALAIKELVTRAIVRGGTGGWSKMYRVYVPTTMEDSQTAVIIKQPDTPKDIWGDVAVQLIDGTELISVV